MEFLTLASFWGFSVDVLSTTIYLLISKTAPAGLIRENSSFDFSFRCNKDF